MERMSRHYARLVEVLVAEPERPVGLAGMLGEDERRKLLVEWNGAARDYGAPRCLHELFEEMAGRIPDDCAVAERDARITYAELNARSNRVARFLRAHGVGPGARVGLLFEPSVSMVVTVLGVLKSGGAYVPVDPSFPRERIAYIFSDARVTVVLTAFADRGGVVATQQIETVTFEQVEKADARYSQAPVENLVTPADAAYVIYTSGSTGKPKGVVVEHRQLFNYFHAITDRFGLHPGMGYAMLQPLAVDSCNTVLIPSLCGGGTLHVMPKSVAIDPYAVRHTSNEDLSTS